MVTQMDLIRYDRQTRTFKTAEKGLDLLSLQSDRPSNERTRDLDAEKRGLTGSITWILLLTLFSFPFLLPIAGTLEF